MSDHPRLSELRVPPGYRVTIHLGDKPERAFPERPKAFGPPVAYDYLAAESKAETEIEGPTARIDIFRDGHAIGSMVVRQSDLDTLSGLVDMVFDELGEDEHPPRRLVEVYCTKCGFNLMENVDTGAKVPMIIRMTEAQIAEATGPDTTCGVCGGPMGARDVPEEPKPETKMYQFPKRD